MAEAAGIFVSHAHEDNAWCRTFVEALRQGGADVWDDAHDRGDGALSEKIERELRARPILLVLLSPHAVANSWLHQQMTTALPYRLRNPNGSSWSSSPST